MEEAELKAYRNSLNILEFTFRVRLSLIEKVALKNELIQTYRETQPQNYQSKFVPAEEAIVRFMWRYYQMPMHISVSCLYPAKSIKSCLSIEAQNNVKDWVALEQQRQHSI